MLGMGQEGESEMNNEAILNKLIELGYSYFHEHTSPELMTADFHDKLFGSFAPIERDRDFLLIQRALFNFIIENAYSFVINAYGLKIFNLSAVSDDAVAVYSGDTSRESFVAAFCKVVGI
jgi:hypothetical protein